MKAKATAEGLALQDWLQKPAFEEIESVQPSKPFKSGYGMLAEYGPAPSAEEIDENRRGMFTRRGHSRRDLVSLLAIHGQALDKRRPNSYADGMEVQFTQDQEAFVRQAIAEGRYQTAEDAVRAALARWEEEERSRIELLTALDEAEADLESGRYTDDTDESLPLLAEELKEEARALRKRG
jgi:putative addiction module CopG family antidote